MRLFIRLLSLIVLLSCVATVPNSLAEEPVELATHQQTVAPPLVDPQQLERIRRIVLHQGNNPRALANLVQLTRELDTSTAATLYAELADEYLRQGEYDQAANFLQQLLNQYHDQTAAGDALLTLMQLYSSSEVNHTQASAKRSGQQGFCQYALHVAGETLRKNTALKSDASITFQRAATARGAGRTAMAGGLVTRLKHNPDAGDWRMLARTEQWLAENREDESPLPTITCRRAGERPHLDGKLNDALWTAGESVQLAYDHEFLYLAVRQEKSAAAAYAADPRTRVHDADLGEHDRVRLWLDLDRDYATSYELAVDHRGWTNDRCWRTSNWNPQWYVAAAADDSTWSVEAAIPWTQLTASIPASGTAWAVAWKRELPASQDAGALAPNVAAPSPALGDFRVLLFE